MSKKFESQIIFYKNTDDEYLQCAYLTKYCNETTSFTPLFVQNSDYPCYPVLLHNGKTIFGGNNIARYFASEEMLTSHFEDLLDIEEFQIKPHCLTLSNQKISWEGWCCHFHYRDDDCFISRRSS